MNTRAMEFVGAGAQDFKGKQKFHISISNFYIYAYTYISF